MFIVTGLLLTSIGRGWRQTRQVLRRLAAVHRGAAALRPHPRRRRPARATAARGRHPARRARPVRRRRTDRSGCSSTSTTRRTSTGTTRCARWSTRRTSSPRRCWPPCCGCATGPVGALHHPGGRAVGRRPDHLLRVPGGAAVAGRARRAEPRRWPGCRRAAGRGCTSAMSTRRWRARRPTARTRSRRCRRCTRRSRCSWRCSSAVRFRRGGAGWPCCIPLAMGFTLVYCGEHYVLDLVAGVAYALAAHWLVSRWEDRRARRTRRARRRARRRTRATSLTDAPDDVRGAAAGGTAGGGAPGRAAASL